MTESLDTQLNRALDAIVELFDALLAVKDAQTFAEVLESKSEEMTKSLQQLSDLIDQHKNPEFVYEFYEKITQVVERVTKLRKSSFLQDYSQRNRVINRLDKLIVLLRDTVYRHSALRDTKKLVLNMDEQALQASMAKLASQNKAVSSDAMFNILAEVRDGVSRATQQAANTSAAADQAVQEGMKVLRRMQIQQQKSGGMVDAKIMEDALTVNVKIMAMHAAAIIASDQAAGASAVFDRVLQAANQTDG